MWPTVRDVVSEVIQDLRRSWTRLAVTRSTWDRTCAINAAGELWCWGTNNNLLGDGGAFQPVPAEVTLP